MEWAASFQEACSRFQSAGRPTALSIALRCLSPSQPLCRPAPQLSEAQVFAVELGALLHDVSDWKYAEPGADTHALACAEVQVRSQLRPSLSCPWRADGRSCDEDHLWATGAAARPLQHASKPGGCLPLCAHRASPGDL
jgi:hypothetical protein